MNELEKAARQALEALETLARYENPETKIQVRKKDGGSIVTVYPHKVAFDALTALRRALEQPTVKESLMVDPTCKQSLQVQCWVIPSSKQFSWDQQDERFWVRMGPVKQQSADEPHSWYSAAHDEWMTNKTRKEHEELNSYTHKVGGFDLALYTRPQPAAPEFGLTWERFNALEAEIATLQAEWQSALKKIERLKQKPAAQITDEQIQDLLEIGNPTEEEMRLIRLGYAAAQPAAQWVGLTDEAIHQYVESRPYYGHCNPEYREGIEEGARWADAKLRKKNAGETK